MLMDALAFCHLLRGQLRGVDAMDKVKELIGEQAGTVAAFANKPDEMVRRMGARIAALHRAGAIDAIGYRILDERLAAISAVQAGCERIAGTPLLRLHAAPPAHRLHRLPAAAVRACRFHGLGHAALHRADRLHLLRPRRAVRGTGGSVRHGSQRPGARQPLPRL